MPYQGMCSLSMVDLAIVCSLVGSSSNDFDGRDSRNIQLRTHTKYVFRCLIACNDSDPSLLRRGLIWTFPRSVVTRASMKERDSGSGNARAAALWHRHSGSLSERSFVPVYPMLTQGILFGARLRVTLDLSATRFHKCASGNFCTGAWNRHCINLCRQLRTNHSLQVYWVLEHLKLCQSAFGQSGIIDVSAVRVVRMSSN